MDECPICGSWNTTCFLDGAIVEDDEVKLICRCECKKCNTKFKEWFKLTDYENEVEEN